MAQRRLRRLSEKEKTIRLTGWSEQEYQKAYAKVKRAVLKGKKAGIYTANLSPAKALRLSVQYPDTEGGIRESLEAVSKAKDPMSYEARRIKEKTKELAEYLPSLKKLYDLHDKGELTDTEFVEAHRSFMSGYDAYRKNKNLSPLEFYDYLV